MIDFESIYLICIQHAPSDNFTFKLNALVLDHLIRLLISFLCVYGQGISAAIYALLGKHHLE